MLSPGTRLGPYELLAAAGAGGMGEVSVAAKKGAILAAMAASGPQCSVGAFPS